MSLLRKASIVTTPTAYENGKILSVKPSIVLGEELVTNGDFATDSDWTLGTDWGIGNNKAIRTGTTSSGLTQSGSFSLGKKFKLNFTITDWTTGSLQGYFYGGGGSDAFFSIVNIGNGTFTFETTTTINRTNISLYAFGSFDGSVSNVSVKEVLDADFDFTRNSSATRVNSQGLIEDMQILSGDLVSNGDFSQEGSELITNGDFATDTNWTKGTGWSIGDGIASRTAQSGSTACDQSISLIANKTYKIVYDLTVDAGSFNVRFSGTTNVNGETRTTSGTYTDYLKAATGNNTFRLIGADSNFIGSIDNVSVKEVGQDWTLGSSNVSIQENKAVYINQSEGSNGIYQNVLSQNKKYKVSFNVSDYQSGDITAWAGSSQNSLYNDTVSGNGLKTIKIENSGSTNGFLVFGNNSTGNYSLENISVIEITEDTNLPRIDYTGGVGHWLFEPQSTNNILYSDNISQSFNTIDITETQNYGVAPNGNNESTRVQIASSTAHYWTNYTLVNGSQYTTSFYYKGVKGETTYLRALPTGGGSGNIKLITFNGDWQREELTFTAGSATNYIYVTDNRAGGGNTATDFQVWGGQLEQLSYATSYIPTEGSIKTRLQDAAFGAGSSDLINSTEGTLYAEIAALANYGTNRTISLSDGSYGNSVRIQYYLTANVIEFRVVTGGVIQAIQRPVITNVLQFNKIAISYAENNFALWVNGVKVATNTSGNTPIGLSELSFDGSYDNSDFYGKAKCVAVFKEALNNDELECLTGEGYETFNALALANNYTII